MIFASIWSRVQYENWHYVLTVLAFAIFFAVFVSIVWKTLRMKKDKLKKVSHMPLENDEIPVSTHESK